MHPEAISAVAKMFVEIGARSRKSNKKNIVEWYATSLGNVAFDRELLEAYEKSVQAFIDKSGCSKTHSFPVVKKELAEYVAYVSKYPDSAAEKLQEVIKGYKSYAIVRNVYRAVDGIKLRVSGPLSFGAVTMFFCSEDKFAEMIECVESTNGEELTPELIKQRSDYISHKREELLDRVVMHYQVCAEPYKATELALEAFSKALDVLRYVGGSIERQKLDIKLGGTAKQEAYLIVSDGEIAQLFIKSRSFLIDEEALSLMEDLQWRKICELQSKVKPTYLEDALLRAVKWYSSAAAQDLESTEFLHYVLALETLFTSKDKSLPVSATIAEGVAFLISDKADVRIRMKKRVKELYDRRSDISHGASHEVDKESLDYLAALVQVCIRMLLDKTGFIKERVDLTNLIEARKYFGPEDVQV